MTIRSILGRFAAPAALVLVLLVLLACQSPDRPMTIAPPAAPSASASTAHAQAHPAHTAPATAEERRSLTKRDRKLSVTKLPSPNIDVDVQFRGQPDAKLVAAVRKSLPPTSRYHMPVASPRGGRFLVSGNDGQASTLYVFDLDGKSIGSHLGDEPFFTADGNIVFRTGQSLWSWDATGAPVALGGPFPKLCVDKTCRPRMFVVALAADHTAALVSMSYGGFVGSDEMSRLDLHTGTLSPVVPHTTDVGYLGGKLFGDGSFCTYEMPVSNSDSPPNAPGPDATLLCFDAPWTAPPRAMMVHPNGGLRVGAVGPLLVTGDVSVLHVIDRKTGRHRSYDLPDGGGLFVDLGDGRSVAIEGDGHVLVVDVVAETYARLDIAQTVVLPLGPSIQGFVATGDGSASLVRFE